MLLNLSNSGEDVVLSESQRHAIMAELLCPNTLPNVCTIQQPQTVQQPMQMMSNPMIQLEIMRQQMALGMYNTYIHPPKNVLATINKLNKHYRENQQQAAVVSRYEQIWQKNLELLKPCIQADGTIDYASLDEEVQKTIRSFVQEQRKWFRKRENNEYTLMTDERYRLLSEAKFIFKPRVQKKRITDDKLCSGLCGEMKKYKDFHQEEYDKEISVCSFCQSLPIIPKDEGQLSLLHEATNLYSPTKGESQSDQFREAIELCEEEGINDEVIVHFIRLNAEAYRNTKITKPYRCSCVKRIENSIRFLNKPLLHYVESDTDRCPLPQIKREDVINTLVQRLSLSNEEDIFQLSYAKPPSESNDVNVYAIPLSILPSIDDDLFNRNKFVDQREFANQNQVTLPLPEEQVISAIEQASSAPDPIAALQQILNDTYHGNNTQGERRQLFFFKGVVYFVWIDVPPEVLRMLEERCKELYEEVMAVKIGYSGEDLIKLLKKLLHLLTYLAGAKLCCIAIGIPFGLCSARDVEQWIHFTKIKLRKAGEWHSGEVRTLDTINHILERTGGKVICLGTVSHGGQSGDGTVRTGCQEDGPGWIYFFSQLFTEEELRELWKMYRELPEGAGENFIRFLLATKVGASRKEDPTKRPQSNFWAMVRGLGKFVAVKGFSKVFEQEAKLHTQLSESQLCGERFMLNGANGNFAIESFLKPLRSNDQYTIKEGEIQRERNKMKYKERETKEWLHKRIISLEEIVDDVMKGIFVLYTESR